ncbi:uncharacterized protein LOC108466158 [Gossypium arboreum]|uniref:uncharacterized protein LOC108466158 n=1 Tax=Gossypium arboreum TaxID=29729 RepID=UPI0008194F8E|nr:uncharacterized protein LOC108466158 [Gossypium arboreum]
MKDILSKKCRLGKFETVALAEGCITMLMNKLPPKLKDPGSFTIPCSIGSHYVGKALCDIRASINLMPMSIFRKLGIGKVRPTTVTLQLVDRSYAHPKGKIDDVLGRVDKFIFPADFLILECEADHNVLTVLGRPFLATSRTLIDVQKDKLTMGVSDQEITFNVFNALKCAYDNEECHTIGLMSHTGLIEAAADEFAKFYYSNSDKKDDLMEQCDTVSFEELGEFKEAQQIMDRPAKKFESLDLS